jgi:hypothetical protein
VVTGAALEKVRLLLDPTFTTGEAEREEMSPTLRPPYTRELVGTRGKVDGAEVLEILDCG